MSSKYKCEKCNIEFDKKVKLECHIANKRCKIGLHECCLCHKSFTTINSMYRHMKHNCKVKREEEDKKNQIYERLIQLEGENKKMLIENEKLKREVEKLKIVKY